MKKKFFILLLTCIILLFSLSACGHKHTDLIWKVDAVNHWQECECGKQLNSEKHSLDDHGYCEICRMTVSENEDGTKKIYTYDEHGTRNGCTSFDSEGNVVSTQVIDYEYYEDGNTKSCKEYVDGKIVFEAKYLFTSDGKKVYESESVFYEDDGTKSVNIYNEDLMLIQHVKYDAQNNISEEEVYDYSYNDKGVLTVKQSCKVSGVLTSEIFFESDESGELVIVEEIFYDEQGNIIEN